MAKHLRMEKTNSAVIEATEPYKNAMYDCDNLLYAKGIGLDVIALKTKSYTLSVFGTSSSQYKRITCLEFRTIKK